MKMNERIRELLKQSRRQASEIQTPGSGAYENLVFEKFAELIVKECIDKIETHRIPVGNSAAGEMACEWTYAALKEIKDEIKEHFGIEL